MTIQERVVVTATVKSRAEEAEGFKLELDIPSFRSRYPTLVSRVPEAVAKLLPPRDEPYTIVLRRQNLKKDKEGRYPYDYYWGLDGLASPQEQAAKAEEPEPVDQRRLQIAWAQAVNLGREVVGGYHAYWELLRREEAQGSPETNYLEDIEGWANRFYPLIRKGPTPQEAPGEASAPTVPTTTSRVATAPVVKAAPAPNDDGFPGAPVWPLVDPVILPS